MTPLDQVGVQIGLLKCRVADQTSQKLKIGCRSGDSYCIQRVRQFLKCIRAITPVNNELRNHGIVMRSDVIADSHP